MVLPEGQKSLGILIAVLGVIAVLGALLAGAGALPQVEGSGYTHTVTPAGDARCDPGGAPAGSRYEYVDLSPRGQSVVDLAVSHPGRPVRTGEPVEEFRYGDLIDPGGPQYVQVDGDCYQLMARAVGIVDPRRLVVTTTLVGVAFVGLLGLLAILVGGLYYRAYD